MSSSRILATRLVLALAAALTCLPALAGARGGGPDRHRLERGLSQLDLSPETREQIDLLFEAARPELDALRDEIHDAHMALRDRMDAEDPDVDVILALAEEIGALQTEMHKQHLRTALAVRELLTPEQRNQLGEMRRELHASRAFGGRHRDGRGFLPGEDFDGVE